MVDNPSQPKSWWNSLSNWWQAHQSNQPKQSLISRLSKSYQDSQTLTKLNLGTIPFSTPRAALQQPDFQWGTVPIVTSGQGSVVPSPSIDQYYRFWQLGQSPDLIERRKLYDEYDKIVSTSVIIAEAMDGLINGAFRQGISTKIVPRKEFQDDPQIQDMAAASDDAWQQVMELITVDWLCLLAKSVLRYGNAPSEIIADDNANIHELRQLSPYAMQINSGPNLKFWDGQKDAYVQFDDVTRTWLARWPEALIVWVMTKDLAWHRYGMSRLYPALSAARALIRAEATLPDSREAGQIQKFERYSDIAGNPAPTDVIEDAQQRTDEWIKSQGGQLNPYRTRIYNGPVEVGLLAPTTSFFNEINDIRWHAGGVASRFGTQLARQQIPETMNRATLDRIDEMAFVDQHEFRIQITEMVLPEIWKRQLAWLNGIMATKRIFYGLTSVQTQYDPRKLRMEIEGVAEELPERLIAKALRGKEDYDSGLLDWETAVEAAARVHGKDAEMVKKRLISEGKGPKSLTDQRPATQDRPALRAV